MTNSFCRNGLVSLVLGCSTLVGCNWNKDTSLITHKVIAQDTKFTAYRIVGDHTFIMTRADDGSDNGFFYVDPSGSLIKKDPNGISVIINVYDNSVLVK